MGRAREMDRDRERERESAIVKGSKENNTMLRDE